MTEITNFKKYMEEIKRERPHLAVGAQHQMALQLCSNDSINSNTDVVEEQHHEKRKSLLSTFMSKMANAKKQLSNNGDRSKSDSTSDEEEEWSNKFGGWVAKQLLQTQDCHSDSSTILRARGTVVSDFRTPEIRNDLSRQDSLEAIESSVYGNSPPTSNYRQSYEGTCDTVNEGDEQSKLSED
eukprot:CAMPEP_0201610098 /NCGR_PEP_ID=MMETSP0492-20130828/15769_1 /ASSEMBLY_ACC=CAM_ASM_000837 /TAXON_ID=420259 /ORGANISM="Thalassiosira gravida, Strain GMp14c1" /LENGTH=182 /DNA_ID=CAMNT_0048075785 /DNA_START=5 /DNA_END=556 /DNA_ORIENTATION=+